MRANKGRALLALAALVVAASVAAGVFAVSVEESAARQRFGRLVDDAVGSGLHVRLPWGIEKVTKVKTGEVLRAEIGADEPFSLLTGDENLIDLSVVIQYKITGLGSYLFACEKPELVVDQAVRAALVGAVARMNVDDVLTSGKAGIQTDARAEAQASLNGYGAGITLVALNLQSVNPPAEAAAAFRNVNDAKAEGGARHQRRRTRTRTRRQPRRRPGGPHPRRSGRRRSVAPPSGARRRGPFQSRARSVPPHARTHALGSLHGHHPQSIARGERRRPRAGPETGHRSQHDRSARTGFFAGGRGGRAENALIRLFRSPAIDASPAYGIMPHPLATGRIMARFQALEFQELSPTLRETLPPDTPVEKRFACAKGLVPLGTTDLLTALYYLSGDKDERVRTEAKRSLKELPEALTLVGINQELSPKILHFIATRRYDNPNIYQKVALHPKVRDETLAHLAARTDRPEIVDIVGKNEQALLRCPDILYGLSHNALTPRNLVERLERFYEIEKGHPYAQDLGGEQRAAVEEARARRGSRARGRKETPRGSGGGRQTGAGHGIPRRPAALRLSHRGHPLRGF
ncbi:MAG: protease modulator HflK [Deltaproteobacteria bacterium]|nr:protease modulator HflK [Deltaproteobacteria bacterium]